MRNGKEKLPAQFHSCPSGTRALLGILVVTSMLTYEFNGPIFTVRMKIQLGAQRVSEEGQGGVQERRKEPVKTEATVKPFPIASKILPLPTLIQWLATL